MLAHLRPVARTPKGIDPALPQALSDAIMTALEVDPARRFPTAEAFAAALSRAIETRAA
jgi:transposase